ncbi:hypothetical protein T03_17764 [Trichinella britovi]|uniref:Uncharacterized protein n=1 Tax=Trichinella britovi TaxID=45882 RepID=A0A0V1AI77_TRIBR|nr:hypothetical protein T03_17764 [Trichinella britovi]KRZ78571.1 hypothetical protein T08_14365 [Trichinella sp. T8]
MAIVICIMQRSKPVFSALELLAEDESENQLAQMKLILSEQFTGKSLLMVN